MKKLYFIVEIKILKVLEEIEIESIFGMVDKQQDQTPAYALFSELGLSSSGPNLLLAFNSSDFLETKAEKVWLLFS